MRLDLNIRLSDSMIVQQGTNDTTPEFNTDKLYFESLIIPIDKPDFNSSGGEIPIHRLFNSTWIGETGTGYHINGQWIDREATKMLSALYLPEDMRTYPYYPFRCDFNTVALAPPDLTLRGRKRLLTYLHKSLSMITTDIPVIEETLKKENFSKSLPAYSKLKKAIPDEWTKIWSSLKISPYLNENEMKEYKLEFELSK